MHIFTDAEWRTAAKTVLPNLAARCVPLTLTAQDGGTLYAETYTADHPRGVVFICHGYSEQALKYRELTWYFLQSGLSVWIPEHRGHGRSARAVTDVTHIDDFSQYASDYACFTDTCRTRYPGLPFYLFAHSMGGAVGAFLMEQQPGLFRAAVLTSPMIAPTTRGRPTVLASILCRVACHAGKATMPLFGAHLKTRTFENSSCCTRARYDVYADECGTDPRFARQICSWGWYRAALAVTKPLMRDAHLIRTPLLLFAAEHDNNVKTPAVFAFARRTGADAILMKGCKHELFTAPDTLFPAYMTRVLAFFGDKTNG